MCVLRVVGAGPWFYVLVAQTVVGIAASSFFFAFSTGELEALYSSETKRLLAEFLDDYFSVKLSDCRTIGHTMAPNPECFSDTHERVLWTVFLEHAAFALAYAVYMAIYHRDVIAKSSRRAALGYARRMREVVWNCEHAHAD